MYSNLTAPPLPPPRPPKSNQVKPLRPIPTPRMPIARETTGVPPPRENPLQLSATSLLSQGPQVSDMARAAYQMSAMRALQAENAFQQSLMTNTMMTPAAMTPYAALSCLVEAETMQIATGSAATKKYKPRGSRGGVGSRPSRIQGNNESNEM